MIELDYQTNNPRWGWSGMAFADWNSYGLILGFLSNIRHIRGYGQGQTFWDDSISIHVEYNDQQGAWNVEGRIHYYNILEALQQTLPDLYNHRSAGVGSITCRINSNYFMDSLLSDLNFLLNTYPGKLTADILPPQDAYANVSYIISNALHTDGIPNSIISECLDNFDIGWNL
jgi:hypothetical protein